MNRSAVSHYVLRFPLSEPAVGGVVRLSNPHRPMKLSFGGPERFPPIPDTAGETSVCFFASASTDRWFGVIRCQRPIG